MNEKIKVLHVIKNLCLGGAEANLLNLASAMDPHRIESHLGYSLGGELEEKFQSAGLKLFKYAAEDHRVKSLASIGTISRLIQYIRQHKIRIVHTHTFSAHIWGSTAAKLTGCRIVEHVHDFRYLEPHDFARRRGVNAQYRFVHKLKEISDRVVVLTRQNRDFLVQEHLYPETRIRVYQNGIPLPERPKRNSEAGRPLIEKFRLQKDALIILTPARLAPEKNVDLIVRIAPEVVRIVPNAVFLIAGDGPLYRELLTHIVEAGMERNIKLTGYHADIRSLLEGADIFLLPSFLELHSIAILEALSTGVPVVTSQDVGCNSEFIQSGENGVLLDPFKDEGWADELIRLLQDPHLRERIGTRGYETCCRKFNIRDTARKFEELYAELVAP